MLLTQLKMPMPTIRRGAPRVRVTYADDILIDVVPCLADGPGRSAGSRSRANPAPEEEES